MSGESQQLPGIDHALDICSRHAAGEGIELADALGHIGPNGFCFAAFLLAVPFVQPVPLGPLTIICGATFIALGWQMARGHETPTLPEKARTLRIHGKFWVAALNFSRKLLGLCRRFTRERFSSWTTGARGQRLVGWLILVGGVLLAVPMANLPLNNFFPALMIVFAAIGGMERDGLMILVSLVWGFATILYFTAVAIALVFFGKQVAQWFNILPA
jgi:hypothetical protein